MALLRHLFPFYPILFSSILFDDADKEGMAVEAQLMPLTDAFEIQIAEHRQWLTEANDSERASRWEQLLAHQDEAAIVEACVRSFLANHVDSVEPAEDLSHGGPDFRCHVGSTHFYVECACMTMKMVEEETALPNSPTGAASYYRNLTQRFFRRALAKQLQCGLFNDGPCLLAIGTLHGMASALCFSKLTAAYTLISQPKISCRMNTTTGDIVGEIRQETDLYSSVFLRPRKNGKELIEPARRDVSGLLLCGFGVLPPRVFGALHPDPARPFDRVLLQPIPFCRLADGWRNGHFKTEWV